MGVMSLFQATLTLPGIAGIVLTIGMAVDANVIIFERIREELRAGKTPRASIATGFNKAFYTIMDANITTLITALVLYRVRHRPIKGFAVTLIVGVLTSVFAALVFTRLMYQAYPGTRPVASLSI
jgi:preprotein translocase subunit SecD